MLYFFSAVLQKVACERTPVPLKYVALTVNDAETFPMDHEVIEATPAAAVAAVAV